MWVGSGGRVCLYGKASSGDEGEVKVIGEFDRNQVRLYGRAGVRCEGELKPGVPIWQSQASRVR